MAIRLNGAVQTEQEPAAGSLTAMSWPASSS